MRNFLLLEDENGGGSVQNFNATSTIEAGKLAAEALYKRHKKPAFKLTLKENKKNGKNKITNYDIKKNKNGQLRVKKGGTVADATADATCAVKSHPLTVENLIQSIQSLNEEDLSHHIAKLYAYKKKFEKIEEIIHKVAIPTPFPIGENSCIDNKAKIYTNIDTYKAEKGKKTFVIITYWWGRGNLNKNIAYPCNEPSGLENWKKKPELFECMITRWIQNCVDKNCAYYVQEFPEFVGKCGYQLAINAKPYFIKKALDACQEKGYTGVVYIDGDMQVVNYPDIFAMENIDFMARGWNIDPRSTNACRRNKFDFHPYVFETSGGIMYFGCNDRAKEILEKWIEETNKIEHEGKADDRILSMVFMRNNMFIEYNTIQLPIEYLWLTDIYGTKVNEPEEYYESKGSIIKIGHVIGRREKDLSGDIIIEHPGCLTSEETAKDQGAAADREPVGYYENVGWVEQSMSGGLFYEFIFFHGLTDAAKKSYKQYLNYLNTLSLDEDGNRPYDVVKYQNRHGLHNDIVLRNIMSFAKYEDLSFKMFVDINHKHTLLTQNTKAATTTQATIFFEAEQTQNTDLFHSIFTEFFKGNDVVINNNKVVKSIPIESKDNIEGFTIDDRNKYEFICTLLEPQTKQNKFKPTFDMTKSIFLSCKSRIIRHLLLMCDGDNSDDNPSSLNNIFRSSFMFLTMIRCKFYDPPKQMPIQAQPNQAQPSPTKPNQA